MSTEMVEVGIDSIRVSLMSQQRIIILKEMDTERYLPIWIGVPETEAIVLALQDVETVRPLTHDLLKKIFDAFNAVIQRVEVTSLTDDIYYGNIVARFQDKDIEIDARPSDALAIAVRVHVPIWVSRQVMENAGITPDEDLQEPNPEVETRAPQEGSDLNRLSIFENYLEKLDLDASDSSPSKDSENEEDDEEDK